MWNKILRLLVKRSRGIDIIITFEGDKGKEQIHSCRYMWFNPYEKELVVDWDKKRISQKGR